MVDWGLGDRPDVSPDNGDDEMYNEMGLVDHRDLGGFLCLVMPFVFKLKNESVAFVIPIPFSATEVETTGVEEVNNSEESDDEEKFRMVVKGMSSAIWVESFSSVRRRPKISRTVDTAKSQWTMERHVQRIVGSESTVHQKEEHVAQKLQRKFGEIARSSRSCRRNDSSRKRG